MWFRSQVDPLQTRSPSAFLRQSSQASTRSRFVVRRITLCLCGIASAGTAYAGPRPLLPGESIVYQTVQSGDNYRVNFNQITGNAYRNLGDEIYLDRDQPHYRRITNIAVGTQTLFHSNSAAYMDGVNTTGGVNPVDAGGFLELSIYLNDGPPDPSGSPFVDATPHGQLQPGTLIAKSRIPTPVYPQGGVSRSANGLNDPNDPSDNVNDPWIVNFPFPETLVPDRFTFLLINLNAAGMPDFDNTDGNHFGPWYGRSQVTPNPAIPGAGGPDYENTDFNANHFGTSRTGEPPYTLTNPGQWIWFEYDPPFDPPFFESDREINLIPEATIYAVIPEPSAGVIALLGVVSVLGYRFRRRSA